MNGKGEEVVSASEAFPDANPAMMLRGKEDITQTELAKRQGISQDMVADMKSGKRTISINMARRIGAAFHVPYRIFL